MFFSTFITATGLSCAFCLKLTKAGTSDSRNSWVGESFLIIKVIIDVQNGHVAGERMEMYSNGWMELG